jgi:hypothetical protein
MSSKAAGVCTGFASKLKVGTRGAHLSCVLEQALASIVHESKVLNVLDGEVHRIYVELELIDRYSGCWRLRSNRLRRKHGTGPQRRAPCDNNHSTGSKSCLKHGNPPLADKHSAFE